MPVVQRPARRGRLPELASPPRASAGGHASPGTAATSCSRSSQRHVRGGPCRRAGSREKCRARGREESLHAFPFVSLVVGEAISRHRRGRTLQPPGLSARLSPPRKCRIGQGDRVHDHRSQRDAVRDCFGRRLEARGEQPIDGADVLRACTATTVPSARMRMPARRRRRGTSGRPVFRSASVIRPCCSASVRIGSCDSTVEPYAPSGGTSKAGRASAGSAPAVAVLAPDSPAAGERRPR